MFTNPRPASAHAAMVIIPVPPAPGADETPASGTPAGLLRRTLGRSLPSRRTFGKGTYTRRTLGKNNYSRRTFGMKYPSRRTFGINHP